MKKPNFKVGDKVTGVWGGERFSGKIINIEKVDGEWVADLDTERWCYLSCCKKVA